MATFFSQLILTGKTLSKFGLSSGLYVTPVALLTGALAIMIWPGLIAAALTRIADAALRNSIHRGSMEIIYMAVPAGVIKSIKTFLDVVVERVGDASAGFYYSASEFLVTGQLQDLRSFHLCGLNILVDRTYTVSTKRIC